MHNQIPTLNQIEQELCERSLYFFIQWVFKRIYKKIFIENWHIDVLCSVMEDVFNGKLQNVVITIPPRYSKTLIVVIGFSAWSFAKNKGCNFLNISYSDSLALRNANGVKEIIFSEAFKKFWNIMPSKSEKSKKIWSIINGGGMYSTASGGAVTGFGAGVKGANDFSGALLIDDAQKSNDERFELSRKTIIENFENVLSSRLDNPKTPIVVIQQRLHEEDLAGYLLSGKSSVGKFHHINIPAIRESGESEYDTRKPGEVLWEYQNTLESLELIKKANPMLFAGQYQQRPAPMEGTIVKKTNLRFYDVRPEKFDRVLISCDLNFKEEGTSNVCYSCYGVNLPNVYLIGQTTGKWNFPDALSILEKFLKEMPPNNGILVEKRANGEAMMAVLRKKGLMGIVGIEPDKSKTLRLSEVSLYYAAGNVWFPRPENEPWVSEHIHEILTFPKGKYDDRVDAETQALKHIKDTLESLKVYRF